MTVTYTAEVATCTKFGCFLKLLFRWRGSIYKLVWMDLLVFLLAFYTLSFVYRFGMNKDQQHVFEGIVVYCESYGTLIPLSFVLGFYVSIVMTRWWDQYLNIPWPDSIAVFVSAHIHGQDDRARLMRRTIMRYVVLCLTIAFSMISPRVKKRFPTLQHLVDAGLLLDNEKLVFEVMNESSPRIPKHWMPIVWAASIVTRARKEGRIREDFSVKTIVDELNLFRGRCGTMMIYDSVPIPLVYTQVVTLAVYFYFLCSVMGQQWLAHSSGDSKHNNAVDYYFPVFTTLQFFFYMGWLKVAEVLINPFGDDDDDFEVNWLIDRNLQVSYLIVDEMHQEHPELVKDQYWDEVFPNELPYDGDAKREEPPEPSTAKLGDRLAAMSTMKMDTAKSPQGLFTKIRSKSELDLSKDELSKEEQAEKYHRTVTLLPSLESLHIVKPQESQQYVSAVGTPPTEQLSQTSVRFADEIQPRSSISTKSRVRLDVPEDDKPEKGPFKPMEGLYEESDDTFIEGEEGLYRESPDRLVKPKEGLHEESEVGDEKDDFQRLKEERERERTERQRLRFVKQMEDAANIAAESDDSAKQREQEALETSTRRASLDATERTRVKKEENEDDKEDEEEKQEKKKEEKSKKPDSKKEDP